MAITVKARYRALAVGLAAAALLAGSFVLGTVLSGTAGTPALASSPAVRGKITVSGTGTVNGTPNQLLLSIGVQLNGSSVGSALRQANQAATRVIAALKAGGVSAADIQTSGLSIAPNYHDGSPVPVGYGVSEQLTATLRDLGKAGRQIQSAVTAGGSSVVVDGVSLNLTDTSILLARARAAAVRDARAKASQFARALHQPLGQVTSISDQTALVPVNQPAAFGAAAASAKVPISPGTQQVSVSITVVYALG
jgi:uncharacterized protein YggE